MFILLLFSLISIIQCQNRMVDPINTNIETCSCDLTKGACDVSCCCDEDCSVTEKKIFNCDSQSEIQSTCFKDISIFRSNSPHVIQKKGDLVCVDHRRDIELDNAYYEELINASVDPSALSRSINVDNSVSLPFGTTANLSIYQVGSSVFRYIPSTNRTTYYTLPVKLFNSPTCSGSQPITYLNDFTSSCSQPVNQQTCTNALDTTKYITNFCLITLPFTLADSNTSRICCNYPGGASSWSAPTCTNALQNLDLTIYYSNPFGIVNCSVTFNTTTVTTSDTVTQRFAVRFLKPGSTSATAASSGNPGYIQGSSILAGNTVGSSITPLAGLTILQGLADGSCSTTSSKLIRFGENVQSTCLYNLATSGSCPNINTSPNIFTLYNLNNLYVAIYGNSNPTNLTNWLPVTFCISEIGSTNSPVCQENSVPSPSAGQCYIRLDVEMVYANYGSVTNRQAILGAVVYHYQSVATASATTFLMTQTVTFQDMSNAPATEGDLIPRPNTRLPGDFFYPFSLNRATNPFIFPSVFYLLLLFCHLVN